MNSTAYHLALNSPANHSSSLQQKKHALWISLGLRAAMLLGFVVVIVGSSRSGKSLILERTTPGKVVCKLHELLNSATGKRPTLNVAELPNGVFSIDELSVYDTQSLKELISNLDGRTFALSAQSKSDIEPGLAKLLEKRRRLIVTLK